MPSPHETGVAGPSETFSAAGRPILLVGHGTRDPVGVREFLELARRVSEILPNRLVEPSFLELAEPTIEQGLAKILESGARDCVVAPLLLFAAGHANRDVPNAVSAALASQPQFAWRQAGALDPYEPLLRLSQRRYDEAIASSPEQIPVEHTLLVWIGRGGSDPHVLDNLRSFAQRRRALCHDASFPYPREMFGFAAAAEPDLRSTVQAAFASPVQRIVIQPHLLFRGRVFNDIVAAARDAAVYGAHDEVDVRIAAPLGPDVLLAQAVVESIHDCERRWLE